MEDGEIKGRKFLEFVAQNDKKLRNNLRKNITFNKELFEDVYQDSIIKVYNSIVKNNKEIEDFEQYFFISSKFNFILKQNAERERLKKLVNIDDLIHHDDEDIEFEEVNEVKTETVFEELIEMITKKFGEENTLIYFDYMSLKVQEGMSYKKYAKLKQIPVNKVRETISKIKSHFKTDTKIKRYRHALDL